jgi:hypothetical protein
MQTKNLKPPAIHHEKLIRKIESLNNVYDNLSITLERMEQNTVHIFAYNIGMNGNRINRYDILAQVHFEIKKVLPEDTRLVIRL